MMRTQQQQQQQYRSRIDIIGDILNAAVQEGQNGVNISAVTRKANLSHYVAIKKCDSLVKAGLIESERTPRNVIFTITDKGFRFFYELKNFQHLMEQVNLKC